MFVAVVSKTAVADGAEQTTLGVKCASTPSPPAADLSRLIYGWLPRLCPETE